MISVSPLAMHQIEEIRPLLARSRQGPYRCLLHEASEQLLDLWMAEIRGWVETCQGSLLALSESGTLLGVAVYADLPWDSRLLRRRMGAIKYLVVDPDSHGCPEGYGSLLSHLTSWASSQGIEFLLCKTYANDAPLIHALEKQGFLLVDTLLDYVFDSRRTPLAQVPRPSGSMEVTIRLAEDDDLAGLLAVAENSFAGHFGRYHSDPRLRDEMSTNVYEEWVRASCAGYADWIVVAEIKGCIAGYSIWKNPSADELLLPMRMGHYSIGATHPAFAGRGIFSEVTHFGMELVLQQADCIEGPTHVNNYPVQRAYTKLQWKIVDARHSFHLWLDR